MICRVIALEDLAFALIPAGPDDVCGIGLLVSVKK